MGRLNCNLLYYLIVQFIKALSYAGGLSGIDAVNRLLPQLSDLLSPKGVFYLVALHENNIDALQQRALRLGLRSEVLLERRCGAIYSRLYVLKFTKRN